MNRKILLGISILVVMLFCIPPVASINVSDIETSTEITRPETPVSDDVKETMVTVDTPTIKRKVEPMYYTEQLQKNREVMQQADPKAYIPDYDYDSLVAKYEPTEYTRSIDRNTQVEMVPPMEPKAFKFGTPSSGSSSKTRAGEADLEVTQMEWSADINSGWVSYTDGETSPGENPIYAGFMVGVETTITVTVVNHNPTTPVSGINMNWSIYDWVAGIPLIKIPTQTPFNIMGATTTVDFKFTPPAAKWLLIIAIITLRTQIHPMTASATRVSRP